MLSATVDESSRVTPSRSLITLTDISQVAVLHISTPFSLMVIASPTSHTPPSGSDSITMQAPVVSPGPAHETDAAPAMDSLTDRLAQLTSEP